VKNGKGGWIEHKSGNPIAHDEYDLMTGISNNICPLDFKILYIGQSYGKDGERNAIDRLKEHSTLQKIALEKKLPAHHRLELILIGIENATTLLTEFNPRARVKNNSVDDERIRYGVDKLFNTSEAERVSLFEAALIRYFQPEYNKQLKNSFPSTNLKLLNDCYNKDMQALVAEINFDDFPYRFCSDSVPIARTHVAFFDLHDDESRRSFFSEIFK
jgi:hypothetical protein